MSIDNIKSEIKDYAKDIRLNVSSVLTTGAPGLSETQIAAIALASAYSTKSEFLIAEILDEVSTKLDESYITASKTAASLMAMNNIYYRFVHLVSDDEFGKMPAGLRMQAIGNPGIDKIDFELMSLAVSAINGCGMCMDAHVNQAVKGNVSKQGVQSCIKIASVINAAAQAVAIG